MYISIRMYLMVTGGVGCHCGLGGGDDFAEERVQPVGLISVSCNRVILNKEIDQMLANSQLNSTCLGLYCKNIFFNISFAQKRKYLADFFKAAISP